MNVLAVEEIVRKAMTDPTFCSQLVTDFKKTLQTYKLSEHELKALSQFVTGFTVSQGVLLAGLILSSDIFDLSILQIWWASYDNPNPFK